MKTTTLANQEVYKDIISTILREDDGRSLVLTGGKHWNDLKDFSFLEGKKYLFIEKERIPQEVEEYIELCYPQLEMAFVTYEGEFE